MIHVVDFEKTAFSTPFRGVLPPFGPQIGAESGRATHTLAPGKPGWPPTSPWPLFSRPTPPTPGPAGAGWAQTFPRLLLPSTDRPGSREVLLPPRSGKEVTSPPPPPLRTARESFPSCSSSLSNALCRTRLSHI